MEHIASLLNLSPVQFACAVAGGVALAVVSACATSACENETSRHRHLVCHDAEGTVVVDTYDLEKAPKHGATAWTWWTTDDAFHMVSVPPHSCVYESHDAEPGCGCGLDEAKLKAEDTRLAEAF